MADSRRQIRACDRCHTAKERCARVDDSLDCERCRRLGHECENKRLLIKAGRKRRAVHVNFVKKYATARESKTLQQGDKPDQTRLLAIPRSMSAFGGLPQLDQQSLVTILDKQTFLDRFVLGPSFHDCHFQSIASRLHASMSLLKDAFLACAVIENASQIPSLNRSNDYHQYCYRKAASGLDVFRSYQISSLQDTSLYLTLALAVLTFNLHVVGGSAYQVCRFTLPSLKLLHDSGKGLDLDDLAFTICFLHTEATGCLLRNEVPTFRFRSYSQPEDFIDRYLGISTPLLSYSYDLCVLNDKLYRRDSTGNTNLMIQLYSLESTISAWRPEYAKDFLTRFSQAEVAHMLAQAQVLRTCLLLVIHRLQYPYSTNTSRAMVLSSIIFEQFDVIYTLTSKAINSMEFAFLVASFEIEDPVQRKEIEKKVDQFKNLTTSYRTRLKSIMHKIWLAVEENHSLYWFDAVEHLLPLLD